MPDLASPIELLRPPSIEFGSGAVAAVGRWAAAKGVRRTLVVSDAFNAGRVDVLGLPGEVVVFGEVKPEPDVPEPRKGRWPWPRGRSPTSWSASAAAAPWTSPSWSPCCPAAANRSPTWSGRRR